MGRRQAGQRRLGLNRGAVGQPGDGFTKGQIGIEPGRTPTLCLTLALRHTGGKDLLGLEDLSRIQVKADTTAGSRSDIGD